MKKVESIYKEEDSGKNFTSRRGKVVVQRKYHLTPDQIKKCQIRHQEDTKDVPQEIKDKAGSFFFNPYRKGMYWSQLQALYLLGANEWHEFRTVLEKIQEISEEMPSIIAVGDNKIRTNRWERFRGKDIKVSVSKGKDVIGRIEENMLFMQRLSCHHPSGYKLKQARASLDIKKVNKDGFTNGLIYYRLSTYSTEEEAMPVRDFSEYVFGEDEKKFYTTRFIGTIITKDGLIKEGIKL